MFTVQYHIVDSFKALADPDRKDFWELSLSYNVTKIKFNSLNCEIFGYFHFYVNDLKLAYLELQLS